MFTEKEEKFLSTFSSVEDLIEYNKNLKSELSSFAIGDSFQEGIRGVGSTLGQIGGHVKDLSISARDRLKDEYDKGTFDAGTPMGNLLIGSGIGALGGGIYGAFKKSDAKKNKVKNIIKNALIGGGLGAGLGYLSGVGNNMYKEHKENSFVEDVEKAIAEEDHVKLKGLLDSNSDLSKKHAGKFKEKFNSLKNPIFNDEIQKRNMLEAVLSGEDAKYGVTAIDPFNHGGEKVKGLGFNKKTRDWIKGLESHLEKNPEGYTEEERLDTTKRINAYKEAAWRAKHGVKEDAPWGIRPSTGEYLTQKDLDEWYKKNLKDAKFGDDVVDPIVDSKFTYKQLKDALKASPEDKSLWEKFTNMITGAPERAPYESLVERARKGEINPEFFETFSEKSWKDNLNPDQQNALYGLLLGGLGGATLGYVGSKKNRVRNMLLGALGGGALGGFAGHMYNSFATPSVTPSGQEEKLNISMPQTEDYTKSLINNVDKAGILATSAAIPAGAYAGKKIHGINKNIGKLASEAVDLKGKVTAAEDLVGMMDKAAGKNMPAFVDHAKHRTSMQEVIDESKLKVNDLGKKIKSLKAKKMLYKAGFPGVVLTAGATGFLTDDDN